jgi:hypothetical protein
MWPRKSLMAFDSRYSPPKKENKISQPHGLPYQFQISSRKID